MHASFIERIKIEIASKFSEFCKSAILNAAVKRTLKVFYTRLLREDCHICDMKLSVAV